MEITSWIFPRLGVAFAALVALVALFGVSHAQDVLEYEVGDTFEAIAYIAQDDDPEEINHDYEVVTSWEWPEQVQLVESTDNWAKFEALTPTEEPIQITVTDYTVTLDQEPVAIVAVDNPYAVSVIHVPRTLRIRISGEFDVQILEPEE